MAPEKRLIDANEIEELFYKQVEFGATDLMDAFDDALNDAQTVDAVEVVHGRWEVYPDWRWLRCTNCGVEFEQSHFPQTRHYCPNCGASMRDGDGNA